MTPQAGSIARQGAGCLAFEIQVDLGTDIHSHPEYRAAGKCTGIHIVLADVVAAVESDTQAVAGERELADLRLHGSARDGLLVDVELGGPNRLAILPRLLAVELHADGVLAGSDRL